VSRKLFLAGFLLCLSMLLIAGYFQFVDHLEPCPLCIIQRVIVLVAGIIFLVAAIHNPRQWGLRVYGFLISATAATGLAVAGRHVWLQSLPADQVPSCGPGLNFIIDNFPIADAISMVMRGSGECAEVVWTLMGLSIPGWTAVAFTAMLIVGVYALVMKLPRNSLF
jgi:disulfide bond formation protein DsbB